MANGDSTPVSFHDLESMMAGTEITEAFKLFLEGLSKDSWTRLSKEVTTTSQYEESATTIIKLALTADVDAVKDMLSKHFEKQMNSEAVSVLMALFGKNKEIRTKNEGVAFLVEKVCSPISQTTVNEFALLMKEKSPEFIPIGRDRSRSHERAASHSVPRQDGRGRSRSRRRSRGR